jgi:biofilm PGA synthesis N-glycosyltransferase PgaC
VETIIAGIFWLTILLLIHVYFLYPVSLRILSYNKNVQTSPKADSLLPISILISAHNEEKVLEERIENIRNLNYDFNKLELIIGSDCSSDKTNEIITQKNKKYNWIKTQVFNKRRGKAAVLNDLVQLAKNEILVFSDANTIFDKNAIAKLVSKFIDEKVGGVCGRLVLEEPTDDFDKTNRERLYWQYETHLKKLEGNLGILIAANGGIYAIRKNLFTKFPVEGAITDDLYQTLAVLNQGYKFLYDYDAFATEEVSKEITTEFKRKVRFASTNYQTLIIFKNLLFQKKLFISYALWSHKVLRWFVPLLLIILFFANTFLIDLHHFYQVTFFIQSAFYLIAIFGYAMNKLKINIGLFSIIYYFALTNLALLVGLIKFLSKKEAFTWESTPR